MEGVVVGVCSNLGNEKKTTVLYVYIHLLFINAVLDILISL